MSGASYTGVQVVYGDNVECQKRERAPWCHFSNMYVWRSWRGCAIRKRDDLWAYERVMAINTIILDKIVRNEDVYNTNNIIKLGEIDVEELRLTMFCIFIYQRLFKIRR